MDYNEPLNGNTAIISYNKTVRAQQNTIESHPFFLTKPFSSICVGYLTHRLVHFRIRVNGPEDNGCMCLPKTQSVGYASAMIIGSKSSIVTTSCICSWVVVVNWFTTFW